ncbi:hypothetical protein PIROE2DRAFT_6294 [Piromyces sp. E2]|nr:hypothetical protein PIROE2DRAFT_6294 [Piromyces sp. E2]|eukprot:OUM66457.1 hypothetical protein PIROE2DRAFT_6294 [Piromyces sp. E2]
MATLNAYVDSLKLELDKYAVVLKNLSKINWKTFLTPENLLSIKEKFCADAQKTFEGVVWNDKFIMVLCMIHALIIIEIIQDRKSYFKQILHFILLTVLSLSSSFLNTLGADNWNRFASKNYFDKNGKFMLYFLNIPVLIELILCLVRILAPSKKKNRKSKNVKKPVKKAKPEPKKPVKDQKTKGNVKPEKKPVKINRKKFN